MDVIKVEPESDSETLCEDELADMRDSVLSPAFALAEVKCEITVSTFHHFYISYCHLQLK
jgi:hypothetical protein